MFLSSVCFTRLHMCEIKYIYIYIYININYLFWTLSVCTCIYALNVYMFVCMYLWVGIQWPDGGVIICIMWPSILIGVPRPRCVISTLTWPGCRNDWSTSRWTYTRYHTLACGLLCSLTLTLLWDQSACELWLNKSQRWKSAAPRLASAGPRSKPGSLPYNAARFIESGGARYVRPRMPLNYLYIYMAGKMSI